MEFLATSACGFFVWPGLPHSTVAGFQGGIFQEREGPVCDLSSEAAEHHLYCIFFKAVRVTPRFKGRGIDFTSCSRRVFRSRNITVIIFGKYSLLQWDLQSVAGSLVELISGEGS